MGAHGSYTQNMLSQLPKLTTHMETERLEKREVLLGHEFCSLIFIRLAALFLSSPFVFSLGKEWF